jgi:hypothetical protein
MTEIYSNFSYGTWILGTPHLGSHIFTLPMSSTIQLPEDKLVELLLELKASNGLYRT